MDTLTRPCQDPDVQADWLDLDEWEAKRRCLQCPVLLACRWEAYHQDMAGVAGAVTETERELWRAATGQQLVDTDAAWMTSLMAAKEAQRPRDRNPEIARIPGSLADVAELTGLSPRSVQRIRTQYAPTMAAHLANVHGRDHRDYPRAGCPKCEAVA